MVRGVQIKFAEIGIARSSARRRWCTYLRSQLVTGVLSRSIPAVAATESAKPGSVASKGSIKIRSEIARPSAASADDLTPRAFAIKSTLTITVARNTDGEGRTKKMKPSSTRADIKSRALKLGISHCKNHNIKAAMIAKFSPLTAVRCVSPDRNISFTNTWVSSEVSPRTRPGMSAPLAPPTCSEIARKSLRIAPVILPTRPAP